MGMEEGMVCSAHDALLPAAAASVALAWEKRWSGGEEKKRRKRKKMKRKMGKFKRNEKK